MGKRRKRKPKQRQGDLPVELQGVTKGHVRSFLLIQKGKQIIEEKRRLVLRAARDRPSYLWGENDRIIIEGLLEDIQFVREGMALLLTGIPKHAQSAFSMMQVRARSDVKGS